MRKFKYISAVFIGETNTLNLKLIRSQLLSKREDSDKNAHVHSMFTVWLSDRMLLIKLVQKVVQIRLRRCT